MGDRAAWLGGGAVGMPVAAPVPADVAAAAHAAQAARRHRQREQLAEPSASLPAVVLPLTGQHPFARQSAAPWVQQGQLPLPLQMPASAMAQPLSLMQTVAGFPQFMAQQPALLGMQAASPPVSATTVMVPTALQPASRRGWLGTPKTCSLCEQPKRGTHQQGCPTHCRDCTQLKGACRCGGRQ